MVLSLLTFFMHPDFLHLHPILCARVRLFPASVGSIAGFTTDVATAAALPAFLNLVSKAVGFREMIVRMASLRCLSCLTVL